MLALVYISSKNEIWLYFTLRYSLGKTKTLVQGQLWSPVGHCSIPTLIRSWSNTDIWVAKVTWAVFKKRWQTLKSKTLLPVICVLIFSCSWQIFKETPADKKPFWSEYVFGFRFMTEGELKRFPDHKFGQAFTTLKCECTSYLPWLEKRCVLY